MPFFSVVTEVNNRANTIERTITSIVNQTFKNYINNELNGHFYMTTNENMYGENSIILKSLLCEKILSGIVFLSTFCLPEDLNERKKKMGIMPDSWIKKMSEEKKMIDPFVEKLVKNNVLSYGLSSYGYDARVSKEFKIFTL